MLFYPSRTYGTADFPVEVEIEVLLVAVELPLNPELVFPDRAKLNCLMTRIVTYDQVNK